MKYSRRWEFAAGFLTMAVLTDIVEVVLNFGLCMGEMQRNGIQRFA